MGLFSRREKSTRTDAPNFTSQSSASVNSSTSRGPVINRTSTTSMAGGPGTPLSPKSPPKLPKVDLPRPPDPQLDPAGYLRSIGAVRDRSRVITAKAMRNDLKHFDVDLEKMPDVVSFVSQLIKVRFYTIHTFQLLGISLKPERLAAATGDLLNSTNGSLPRW